MALFYSAATGSFYDDAIHRDIPADARTVSSEQHAALLQMQGQGKIILPDAQGAPVAMDPPPRSPSDYLANIRAQRDKLLRATDYTQMPDLPIDPERRAEWAVYRQALRDLPASPEILDQLSWPIPPEQ